MLRIRPRFAAATVTCLGLAFQSGPAISQVQAQAEAKQAKQVEGTAGDELEFEPFARPREVLGDPVVLASDEARVIWDRMKAMPGVSESFGDLLLQGGDYASIGHGCHLVRYAAIHLTCNGSPDIRQLTPWYPPGNTEVVEVRRWRRGGGFWALVRGGELSRGITTGSYHAILVPARAGPATVMASELASASSAFGETGEGCAEGQAAIRTSSILQDHAVLATGARRDVVRIRVLREDCASHRKMRTTLQFAVTPGGVRRIR